jgi:hypothetical protein
MQLLIAQILCFGVFALAGVALGFAIWSRTWRSSPGYVDISIFERGVGDDGDTLALSYSYTVAGQQYAGQFVRPLGLGDRAERNGRKYRERMNVTVYYCPMRPQWSCLEPGQLTFPVALLIISALGAFVLLPALKANGG